MQTRPARSRRWGVATRKNWTKKSPPEKSLVSWKMRFRHEHPIFGLFVQSPSKQFLRKIKAFSRVAIKDPFFGEFQDSPDIKLGKPISDDRSLLIDSSVSSRKTRWFHSGAVQWSFLRAQLLESSNWMSLICFFGWLEKSELPSLKLTFSALKINGWKMNPLWGWLIFRGYVSFRECKYIHYMLI